VLSCKRLGLLSVATRSTSTVSVLLWDDIFGATMECFLLWSKQRNLLDPFVLESRKKGQMFSTVVTCTRVLVQVMLAGNTAMY
jgi:hypothetical protein